MTKYLIGAGGWAYFHVPGLSHLEAYAQAFNFVEVNSTFYEIPSLGLVKSWRQRVPTDFEFSVRCHKDVTHRFKLEPFTEAINTFKMMVDICSILKSHFLVLLTPPSLDFTPNKIESIRHFFESIEQKRVRIIWELRRRGEPIPSDLLSLMKDYHIIHCVDLSKEDPLIDSNIVYTRVFGKGEHNIYQFTDEELLEIDERIYNKESETAVISFHNVKMYKDAARYKIHHQTKTFPPVTKAKGQQSLMEVLGEDVEFPISKQELIKDQGWKVIDLTDDKRIHASRLLETLPDKRFRNIEEVMKNLHHI
jgi:uncharacterized protein YecE (DUF72 family)